MGDCLRPCPDIRAIDSPTRELSSRRLRTSGRSDSSRPAIEPNIFLPWQVHKVLNVATQGDKPKQAAVSAYFLLAGVAHETAHWMSAQRHGYKLDPTPDANLMADIPRLDF
ncbi:hypothetical protein AURDEDRAFT_165800 [Auricularia subglabra TFB-10046 SS5]|nr:hypothetical protein AURDEDRAFT_165800 [Auricularia subglabra TFB-10046 SS5]